MDLIADILLITGAIGAAFYCFVLSRRLTRFTDLERGVGGAVAVLSAQVDDLTKALEAAKASSDSSGATLKELTERADSVARRLELHVAALHDVDTAPPPPPSTPSPAPIFTSSARSADRSAAPATQSFFAQRSTVGVR
ncbi:hypothetical protein [Palleronia abyssalis]|uniref:Uncharacterized protein n=1 Tax=Palleronia abyssalis TaxID=1501240 RepID=A0A2R8BWZ7_9RHOB|nr:hypothetical protein [Palleronia abyssalis]SPJ24652.1 hypothetical protein PAA8504_02489 [Palleronia abyssalis]